MNMPLYNQFDNKATMRNCFVFFTGTDEINFKPAPDYQNLAIGTTFSTDRQAHDSIEFASTYQELNQDTRDGTEYSTLDEITPT